MFHGEIELSGTGPPKIGSICLVVRANPPSIDFRGGYAPPGVPPPVHGPTPIRGPTDANFEVTPPFLFVGPGSYNWHTVCRTPRAAVKVIFAYAIYSTLRVTRVHPPTATTAL